MNLGPARFIYFFRTTLEATVMTDRSECGELLFTCPHQWVPVTQRDFEAAARYYGVKDPQRMRYNPDEIPF